MNVIPKHQHGKYKEHLFTVGHRGMTDKQKEQHKKDALALAAVQNEMARMLR